MAKSKEDRDYELFLESSVVEDAEAIDVPSVYDSLQSPIRNWDGNSQLPTVSKEEDLDDVVNKILRKSPDEEGADDPSREEGGKTGTIAEVGNLADDAKKEVEGNGEADEADAEGEDCPDCDKKIQEIYRELGISPLALLEDDDEDDEDDDDEGKPGHEEGESKEDEKKENAGNLPFPGAAAPFGKKEVSEGFSAHESKIIESLIHEMGLAEEGDVDEFSDEEEGEEEGDENDEVEFGDEDSSDA